MPGDLNSPKASTSPVNPPRRQNTSCDPCRRSKRRCVVQSDPDGIPDAICANCRRLKRQCTFEFAIAQSNPFSRKRQRRDCGEPSFSTTQNEYNDFDTTTDAVAGTPSNRFDATSIAEQDVLAAWLNLDYDEIVADSVNSFSTNLDPSNPLTALRSEDKAPGSQSDGQLTVITPQLTRLRGGQNLESNCHRPTVGLSFDSPIYLLNSGIDAKIFGDRLARIYEAIATASASRFLDYDCNLYATKSRYRLGESDSGSSNGSAPTSSAMDPITISPRFALPVSSQAMPYEISLLGSVRFLDHLGDLYGNRLNSAARKKSDETFKAVLRAFSMQWLPSSPSPSFATSSASDPFRRNSMSGEAGDDSSLNAFIDAWVRARSLLNDAHDIRSFRVVLATLMFVGIVAPTKITEREDPVPNHFLDTALQKLSHLDGLVTQYCANLGPSSTYSALAEASLSIVRWTAYIRDTGAALAMDRQCKLPDLWGTTTVLSDKEPVAALAVSQNILELDINVQPICRKASAETFIVWRQIINIKTVANRAHGTTNGQSSSTIEAINLSVAAVRDFSHSFQPFILHCIRNFHCLSTCPRISLVSLVMFWNLGIFLLVEVFKKVIKDLDPSMEQEVGPTVREYQRDAASCVAQVVECVLDLPAEEAFNLQNGLGAEVPLTAYHVTPSLVVTALQRAIESVIDLQLRSSSDGASSDDAQFLIPDGVWDRQLDILMKGLMSLDVTIGGSQTVGVALSGLMHKHGDILSECWTSGFGS
ncbi:hypothetical protein N7455_011302 [Penicillium solitum]|uniref:uncharacterized protein n=1 Tax=Penicillium solitum TaxID=60172 RepID=UPI0017E6CEBA|nr:hypothetical protein HAV15_009840 [Penicillium sp. str. \